MTNKDFSQKDTASLNLGPVVRGPEILILHFYSLNPQIFIGLTFFTNFDHSSYLNQSYNYCVF
jgi:hypothetical protein